uniref:Uncharacterized protein n=1 Tax=Caenorhabditis japonica TaxID=281687 RepID=A0A8R1EKI1_CAEJA
MDGSHKLERDVKAEIKRTEGYHRLEKFPYVRAITVQLASSWRAMVFYQRSDLQQIFNDFVTNFKVLAEKINSLPLAEKQYISSGYYNLSSLNMSMTNLASEAEKLPLKLIIKKQSLKSFGEIISAHYKDQLSSVDFDLMTTTLHDLKSTSIGRSQEVYNVEQSLEKLNDLQHATNLNKLAIVPLLAQADTFFQEFFYLESKNETR